MNPLPLVNARVVAQFLGIKEATVYTLATGRRGFKQIEPLPCHRQLVAKGTADSKLPKVLKKNRLHFNLHDVEAWRARTGFYNTHRRKRGVRAKQS